MTGLFELRVIFFSLPLFGRTSTAVSKTLLLRTFVLDWRPSSGTSNFFHDEFEFLLRETLGTRQPTGNPSFDQFHVVNRTSRAARSLQDVTSLLRGKIAPGLHPQFSMNSADEIDQFGSEVDDPMACSTLCPGCAIHSSLVANVTLNCQKSPTRSSPAVPPTSGQSNFLAQTRSREVPLFHPPSFGRRRPLLILQQDAFPEAMPALRDQGRWHLCRTSGSW
jgi:hypothetical protein